MLTLTADKHIPLVTEIFSPFFNIELLDTDEIQNKNLKQTDILLVRSVTRVNQRLLENTQIKFVASPISGFDHIDNDWLEKKNISWYTARGCNAQSVADYVTCCIAIALQKNILSQKKLRIGIIGVGHVGSLVANQLKTLDFEILLNDPPRAEFDKSFLSTPLKEFSDLDVICLHTPLITNGNHPTYHLIEKNFLSKQKENSLIISAGRGAVVNFEDLKKHDRHLHWCIDVWENEPKIDLDVLSNAFIATPHIAGHAIQSKWRGTQMVFEAIRKHFSLNLKLSRSFKLPITPPIIELENVIDWKDAILQIYNPLAESIKMKETLADSKNVDYDFELLRKNYPTRHELNFPILNIKNISDENKKILRKIGCKLN